jgi:hypothetical protein
VRRRRWFEIHDSWWFPGFLRDRVTEALEAVWNANRTYHPIAGQLREALRRTGATRVVDLCSGGGGPWIGLHDEVAGGRPLAVYLTDRHPSALAEEAVRCCAEWLTACPDSIDARHLPDGLKGFRTIFSAFHHFDPEAARAMLADAVTNGEGIAVFEGARCDAWTMLGVLAVPLLAMRESVRARPMQRGRIVWTWLLPVVPAVLLIDGLLSCLRSYSLDDLRELADELGGNGYMWETGDAKGGRVPIRYLIGTPQERIL